MICFTFFTFIGVGEKDDSSDAGECDGSSDAELSDVDLSKVAKYPGVESSVVEVAKPDVEYFGDIKFVC